MNVCLALLIYLLTRVGKFAFADLWFFSCFSGLPDFLVFTQPLSLLLLLSLIF